ncbi:hypothetical protein FT637_29925 [Bacillus cereus]|uniref:hypothetical protein n=1 Tax=Bacillus cereus TaxID=1396 RepID=UPI00187A6136|nr:hypothetical protein [Bacillus cereus]MBE7107028.1 hypothetical protein [Bacillus cereus]
MNLVPAETQVNAMKLILKMNESMNKITEALQSGDLDSCNVWNEKHLEENKQLENLIRRTRKDVNT